MSLPCGIPSKIFVMPIHPDLVFTDMVETILTCDSSLFDLVVDVNSWSRKTRTEWLHNRSTDVAGLDDAHEDRVLVNYMGRTTVMPDYDTYCHTWRRSFQCNPFEVEWLNYDCKDKRATRFIDDALDVMDKQSTIWSVDADTRVCLAFIYFERFRSALRLLREYSIEVCINNIGGLKIDDSK